MTAFLRGLLTLLVSCTLAWGALACDSRRGVPDPKSEKRYQAQAAAQETADGVQETTGESADEGADEDADDDRPIMPMSERVKSQENCRAHCTRHGHSGHQFVKGINCECM